MEHIIDKPCSCIYCQMIDIMHGDPLLSQWETKFVRNVCSYGGHYNYSPKQKAVIKRIFIKQQNKYREQS